MYFPADIVKEADYEHYLKYKGKGWVCEAEEQLVGFCLIDLVDKNVWALFVDPPFEGQGIGRQLHFLMMDWYFKNETATIWLGTGPGTRAEAFYLKAGWKACGLMDNGELRFEMDYERWSNLN